MVMLPYHRFADVAFLANTFPVFFFGVSSDTFLNFQTHSLNIALKSRLRIHEFFAFCLYLRQIPSSKLTSYNLFEKYISKSLYKNILWLEFSLLFDFFYTFFFLSNISVKTEKGIQTVAQCAVSSRFSSLKCYSIVSFSYLLLMHEHLPKYFRAKVKSAIQE